MMGLPDAEQRLGEQSRIEWIEERAGIIEFEGGKPRRTAERQAAEQWVAWEAARGNQSR